MADGENLPPEIIAPLAPFAGEAPPAPEWFMKAIAHEPERRFIEVDGARVELLLWGEVGKPGLVFLHGNGAHADWWSFIAPFFAADYRIASISWSGMGGSDWRERYSSQVFGREIMAAVEAGELGERPIVVAHSFGGYQALHAAGAYADHIAAAVIVDSVIHPPEKRWNGPPPRQQPNRVYTTLTEALARFRLAPPQGCENLYIADFIARRSLTEVEGGWTWKFDPFFWSNFDRADLAGLLPAVRAPLAMIWGERSQLVDDEALDYMFGLLPTDVPKVVIPEADHHVMIDQPLAFVAALRGLLAGWPG